MLATGGYFFLGLARRRALVLLTDSATEQAKTNANSKTSILQKKSALQGTYENEPSRFGRPQKWGARIKSTLAGQTEARPDLG